MYDLTMLFCVACSLGACVAFSADKPVLGAFGVLGAVVFFFVSGPEDE